MLKMIIETNQGKACINYCDSWDKIHHTLRRVGINESLYMLRMDEPNYSMKIIKSKQGVYTNIAQYITPDESLVTIYEVCKNIQYSDVQYIEHLKKHYDSYSNLREIADDYYSFVRNQNNCSKSIDTQKFESIILFDKPVLFTEKRIPSSSIPKGIYQYEVRQDDDCRGIMCEIGKWILINHWGTILSSKEIKLDSDGYRAIDEDTDVKYLQQPSMTLKEYMHQTSKNKEQVR